MRESTFKLLLESSHCRWLEQEGTRHWDRKSPLPLRTHGRCSGGNETERCMAGERIDCHGNSIIHSQVIYSTTLHQDV